MCRCDLLKLDVSQFPSQESGEDDNIPMYLTECTGSFGGLGQNQGWDLGNMHQGMEEQDTHEANRKQPCSSHPSRAS